MKKLSLILILTLAIMALLPAWAMAATMVGGTATGAFGATAIDLEAGYQLELQTAADAAAETYSITHNAATTAVYDDVAKMSLQFSGEASSQYLVFLLKDGQVPTANNIRYIDQSPAAADGSLQFNIYPDSLNAAGTYNIYMSGNAADAAYQLVGSFEVLASWSEMQLELANVSGDTTVTAYDASMILSFLGKSLALTNTQQEAGMVSDDADLTAFDSSLILQKLANIISSYPIEN